MLLITVLPAATSYLIISPAKNLLLAVGNVINPVVEFKLVLGLNAILFTS